MDRKKTEIKAANEAAAKRRTEESQQQNEGQSPVNRRASG